MDRKGFVFSTDILLALVIVTMALGFTINQFDVLNFQLQDFTGRQSLERTANDAADYLVKNPGSDLKWEKKNIPPSNTLPGLAFVDRATSIDGWSNVFAVSNYLDVKKIAALRNNQNLLFNLVQTNNYHLSIKSLDNSWSTIEMGNTPPVNVKEVAVANRTVTLIPGDVLLQMTDLAHLNPNNPNESPYLWYWKANNQGGVGKPAVYVGPSTGDWEAEDNNTVYITQDDINLYDFYIRVDTNQGGGSGVSKAQYGFTSANWAVNGTYGANGYIGYDPRVIGNYDDDNRWTAIDEEIDYIYDDTMGGTLNIGWQDINNQQLDAGDFIYVNYALNQTYNRRGSPYFRLWFNVPSDVNADFSISLVRTFHGQDIKKVPANLIVTVWESP